MKKPWYFIFYIYYEWDQCVERSLIKAFAKEIYPNRVLVINRPGDLLASLFQRKVRRIDRLLGSLPGKNLQYITDNLALLRPFMFINESIAAWVPGLNRLQNVWLRWLLTMMGLAPKEGERVVTWFFSPIHWPFANMFPADVVIYEPVDEDNVTYEGLPIKRNVDMESKMLRNCDLVFTLSAELAKKKAPLHQHVHWLGQGVEVDLFSKALDPHTEIPTELENIAGPRIGLIGNIRGWIDFKLVEEILNRCPQWSIIFIGPRSPSADGLLESLMEYKNFFWLGPKPYGEIYRWLAGLDVGIVPYLQNEVSKYCQPGKLYEYWAAGLPSVITRIGEYKPIDHCLWIADGVDDFIEKTKEALADNSPSSEEVRVNLGKTHSWENIVKRALGYFNI